MTTDAFLAEHALAGVRVVDLSTTFMGPYSTRLLAQWGADVVKLEAPPGDVVRGIADNSATGLGPIFVNANTGKGSLCLHLKTTRGRAVLDRLLDTTVLLVHSMRDRALTHLRLTSDEVLAAHPKIVHCGFRGYGAGGRYASLPAYDDIIQAAGGRRPPRRWRRWRTPLQPSGPR